MAKINRALNLGLTLGLMSGPCCAVQGNPPGKDSDSTPLDVTQGVYALAGEGHAKTSRLEIQRQIKAAGAAAIPELSDLVRSTRPMVRAEAGGLLLQIQGAREPLVRSLLEDPDFAVRAIPVVWSKAAKKGRANEAWASRLRQGNTPEIFAEAVASFTRSEAKETQNSLRVEKRRGLAFEYLKILGTDVLPRLEDEIASGRVELMAVYVAIAANDRRGRFGIPFLVAELLRYDSEPYKSNWNRTHYIAGTILSLARRNAAMFELSEIDALESFVRTRDGNPKTEQYNADRAIKKALAILKK